MDTITYDSAAALLDGATPLHCAAIRGNPAQIDHFLYCGADPNIRSNIGDLPLELLPYCSQKHPETGIDIFLFKIKMYIQ